LLIAAAAGGVLVLELRALSASSSTQDHHQQSAISTQPCVRRGYLTLGGQEIVTRGVDLVSLVTRGALVRRDGRAGRLQMLTIIQTVISVWKVVVSETFLGMGIEDGRPDLAKDLPVIGEQR
jgi:hypothetical protein